MTKETKQIALKATHEIQKALPFTNYCLHQLRIKSNQTTQENRLFAMHIFSTLFPLILTTVMQQAVAQSASNSYHIINAPDDPTRVVELVAIASSAYVTKILPSAYAVEGKGSLVTITKTSTPPPPDVTRFATNLVSGPNNVIVKIAMPEAVCAYYVSSSFTTITVTRGLNPGEIS